MTMFEGVIKSESYNGEIMSIIMLNYFYYFVTKFNIY
jgi:hypothetical protein